MITVFTSCHNQAQHLAQAIESVLNQTFSDFEYLIYDDGSTDNTWDIIQSYAQKDKRIRPFRIDKSPNVGVVINQSIREARGDVWTWCPSDDIWLPNLLEAKNEEAKRYPKAIFYSDWILINEHGLQTGRVRPERYTPEEFKKVVWEDSPIGFTGIWIPMETFKIAGLFPEHLNYSEDFYWMIKATIHDIEFRCIPQFLYKKRTHPNTTTKKNLQKILQDVPKIREELKRYKETLKAIPKKMHFFWANESMSWMRYMTLFSFRKLNPDWSIELHLCRPNEIKHKPWTDEPVQDFFNFRGKDYIGEVERLGINVKQWELSGQDGKNWQDVVCSSHKSNFFKWQKLATEGGFYSDLDILYLRPMDEYYEKVKNQDLVICYGNKYFSIGFLGSSPNNKFYKDIFQSAFDNYNVNRYQAVGVENIYTFLKKISNIPLVIEPSRIDLWRIIETHYPDINAYNNKMELVYPWTYDKMGQVFNVKHTSLPDGCIGIHWYAGDRLSQKYNNLLTEENYKDFDNTFCYFVDKVLNGQGVGLGSIDHKRKDYKIAPSPKTFIQKKSVEISRASFLSDRFATFSTEVNQQASQKDRTLFSVLVPTYNQARYLPQALDSILNQTYDNWEAVVVNDGSTDNTVEVLNRYAQKDKRFRVIHKENGGVSSALNEGIKNSTGRWICWLSSDDMFEPDKLEVHVQAIKENPDIRFFHTNYYIFDEKIGAKCTLQEDPATLVSPVELQVLKFFERNCSNGISVATHREVFDRVGLFDEKYRYGQDFDMWLRINALYRAHFIDRKTVVTRWHRDRDTSGFPEAGFYDSSWSCIQFLNSHRFGEYFPLVDLTTLSGAAKAVRETLTVVCNPNAMMYRGCFNTVLLERLCEWIVQDCPAGLKCELVTHLQRLIGGLADSRLPREMKAELAKFSENIATDFHFSPHDFLKEAVEYAKKLFASGQKNRAGSIKRYLSMVKYENDIPDSICNPTVLVSVIMPAYNADGYITKAIESVLIQDYTNFELIVVDDGSTDNTPELIKGFKDDRIKCFYRENTAGASSARNMAIRKSEGDFIITLDADDMITPDFIRRHLNEFEKHPDADLIYCDDYLIDEEDKPIRIIERPEYKNRKILIRNLFRCGFPVVPFRTCIRRSVFDQIGFFDEDLAIAEDYDMMRRFVEKGLKACHLRGALYLRRMTDNSLSRNFTQEKAKAHFAVVERFIDTFSHDELFPDVEWGKIEPQRRHLNARCLAAMTMHAIGKSYLSNAPVCTRLASERASSLLDDCLSAEPENVLFRKLAKTYQLIRTNRDCVLPNVQLTK